MIKEILNKHVMISIHSGSILKGFVSAIDEKYCKLIEPNNLITIIKLSDISFAKLGVFKKENEIEVKEVVKNSNNDFSVPMYDNNEQYKYPSFMKEVK